jgi:hypothetical protein
MATIRLIVTGDLEALALHESLRRVFGDFRHDGEEVIWDPPRKLHSATSRRLSASERPSRPMRDLAKAMFSEVTRGKHGTPADLVIVIDDVELGNVDQEVVIVESFKEALKDSLDSHLKDSSLRASEQFRERLRERCSFHLLRSMVESYFFGDGEALRATGVQSTPMLRHADVERFETIDPDPDWLQECRIHNQRQQPIRPWWRHECHPKHYLEHLLEREGIFYDEKIHGEPALQSLAWRQVPKTDADCAVVRCLFEDLADWFGISNPLGSGDKQSCLYPGRSVARSKLLLRNL